jgi:cysteine desulfuration protein SufE
MFNTDNLSSVHLSELIAAPNWQAQYRLITQWGKLIQTKPELRVAENLLQGCEVSAWLAHATENDIHYFAFDSDSRVINGLAALLIVQVNGRRSVEISAVNFSTVLSDVGLEKHLTPSRNNGLREIVLKINELTAEN